MTTVSIVVGRGDAALINGFGTEASFYQPRGISMDSEGTLFVADCKNHCIRKITSDRIVTTLARSGAPGFTDGAGDRARFNRPFGVCVNDRRNRVNARGNGTAGHQDGNGVGTMFSRPRDLVIDSDGNILVADTGNHRIRKITADGLVTTVAEDGGGGYRDGDGAHAQFHRPRAICIDSEGVVDWCCRFSKQPYSTHHKRWSGINSGAHRAMSSL